MTQVVSHMTYIWEILVPSVIHQIYNDYVVKELLNNNMDVGDKYHVSRNDLIRFICKTIDELNKRFEKNISHIKVI